MIIDHSAARARRTNYPTAHFDAALSHLSIELSLGLVSALCRIGEFKL